MRCKIIYLVLSISSLVISESNLFASNYDIFGGDSAEEQKGTEQPFDVYLGDINQIDDSFLLNEVSSNNNDLDLLRTPPAAGLDDSIFLAADSLNSCLSPALQRIKSRSDADACVDPYPEDDSSWIGSNANARLYTQTQVKEYWCSSNEAEDKGTIPACTWRSDYGDAEPLLDSSLSWSSLSALLPD